MQPAQHRAQDPVYDELVVIDSDAHAVASELTAGIDAVADAWFVDVDALVDSADPAHVVYLEPPARTARGSSMRFVLATCCLVLAVAACVGVSV